MNRALFGGSFDPIHEGHVAPVREARRTLGLDQVVYLPTGQPPHKPDRCLAPALSRYATTELALLDEPGLEVSGFELGLGSPEPSYTIDSVAHFRRKFPADRLFLILGSDSLASFHRWRRWREIAEQAELVVLARPGWSLETLEDAPAGATPVPEELIRLASSSRVHRVDNPLVAVSSTALRSALAGADACPPGLNALVFRYLKKYALYGSRS